jgi:hypothetical protein
LLLTGLLFHISTPSGWLNSNGVGKKHFCLHDTYYKSYTRVNPISYVLYKTFIFYININNLFVKYRNVE